MKGNTPENQKNSPVKNPEQQSPAPDLTYLDKLKDKKFREKEKENNEQTLRDTSISDIRYKDFLFTKSKSQDIKDIRTALKTETAHQMNAYTEGPNEEGYYKIDYQKIGGRRDERLCGLGEILRDKDIRKVEVIRNAGKSTEERIIGIRTIIEGGIYDGRVGYKNEKTGEYLATYTGDLFKIAETRPLSDTEYQREYLRDKTQNEKNKQKFEAQQARAAERVEYQAELERGGENSPTVSTSNSPETEIDKNQSISSQIQKNFTIIRNGRKEKIKLKSKQLEMVDIIENEFTGPLKKEGLSPLQIKKVVAAAVVNAFFESGLNPKAQGDWDKSRIIHKSIGLFQLNIGGGGKGMTITERQDPVKNCQRMLKKEVLGSFGKRYLLPAARKNASIRKLTQIFCQYLERPGKAKERGQERAQNASAFFPEGVKEEKSPAVTKAPETKEKTDRASVHKKIKIPTKHHTFEATINVKSGQDRWIIGSSGAVHLDHYHLLNKEKSGVVGIGGAGAGNFFSMLKNYVWKEIEDIKLPKEIILVGMAVNTPGPYTKIINQYKEIASFFESKGVNVKFATVQIAHPQGKDELAKKCIDFNEALRKKFPYRIIDIAKYTSSTDGKGIHKDLRAGDGIHLNPEGRRIYAALLEGRPIDDIA